MYSRQELKIGLQMGVLIALVSVVDGAAGARLIYKLLRIYLRSRRKANRDVSYREDVRETTLRSVLTRLKKGGLVENAGRGLWKITPKGKKLIDSLTDREKAYEDFRKKYAHKRDTIIIFDVPEYIHAKRDELRAELIVLGYQKLQQSVWIGGSPLPKEFLEFLSHRRLLQYVHIFTIREAGTISW